MTKKLGLAVAAAALVVIVIAAARLRRERRDASSTRRALEVLHEAHPTWSVTPGGPLELNVKVGSTSAVMHLDNAVTAADGDAARFDELVAESARNLSDALAERAPPSFEAARARLRPVLVPKSFAEAQGVAWRPFAGEVVEAWVLDSARRMTYVTKTQPEEWKVDLGALHDAGSNSLWDTARSDPFQTEAAGVGKLLVLGTEDHYAASRLAVAAARAVLAERLGTPFYAAVPTREVLFACDSAYPRALLAERAKARFAEGPYPISAQLFRVERDSVVVDTGL